MQGSKLSLLLSLLLSLFSKEKRSIIPLLATYSQLRDNSKIALSFPSLLPFLFLRQPKAHCNKSGQWKGKKKIIFTSDASYCGFIPRQDFFFPTMNIMWVILQEFYSTVIGSFRFDGLMWTRTFHYIYFLLCFYKIKIYLIICTATTLICKHCQRPIILVSGSHEGK